MVKLGDFGISKELKDDTKTDSFIGTVSKRHIF